MAVYKVKNRLVPNRSANSSHWPSNHHIPAIVRLCCTSLRSGDLRKALWLKLSCELWGQSISQRTLQTLTSLKSFCLRDRGRLGNRGRPIWLKFGTLSYYGDLCNMPKFQLHCSYLGWVLDVTLFGVPQCFFYSPFWALFNTLITMSGIF